MTLLQLEKYLHQQIPLSGQMGIRVVEWTKQHLILKAPLQPNRNHLGTAFGGSLNAVATLAGYSAVWLALDNPDAHVVIRESKVSFLRPVAGEIRAICEFPGSTLLETFRSDFARKGKARITLSVTIEYEGHTAVEFSGVFVALRPDK